MISSRNTPPRAIGPADRVEQFFTTLTHRHSQEIDDRIRTLLNDDDQWRLVARLPPFDRAHHLRVHDRLVTWGYTDPDLLRAALLHDVGKSNGTHRVRLWVRVARVLGRRWTPDIWRRLARSRMPCLEGLYLAERHAELGASLARIAGASPRCQDFISKHEDPTPTGDPLLDALIDADEAA